MKAPENIEKFLKKFYMSEQDSLESDSEKNKQVVEDALSAYRRTLNNRPAVAKQNIWRIIMKSPTTKIAAAASFLMIVSFVISFVLYGKVIDLRNELNLARQDSATTLIDDSVTINFYLKEHQDTIARYASHDLATEQSMQMLVDYDDILYYELFGNQPEFLNPGIIVRGPSLQNEISMPESSTISNGHSLTLPEAQEATDFDLVSPLWLEPCYTLDQIRRIEGCDTMQLLYTDGINSVSLFEQPLDGQRGLSPQDFREYAVYRNKEQTKGTILAWKDGTLSYVLIGNIEMLQLMNMAQSISVGK